MRLLRTVTESFARTHKHTKTLLRACVAYLTAILTCSALCCICAGKSADYYTAMQLAADLFAAVRPTVGVTALGALLFESVLHGSS